MPLPTSGANTPWPPTNMANQILPKMQEWSAWYSADIAKLQAAYGGGTMVDSTGFFASDTGGFKPNVAKRIQRWFVGQPARGPERNTKVPVPVAGEIAQASADLLFSDPPTFIVDDAATQDRLNELCDDVLFSTLAQGAEMAAALGGTFLKVCWDTSTFADHPFIDVVDADMALPEFSYNKLAAVTFWSVLASVGNETWRLLERHELDPFGIGTITYGLYQGDNQYLGVRVGLGSLPQTTPLAILTQDSPVVGQISSETPGLAVVYVPNMTPNRQWRRDPVGRHLGRSDIDGVEHLIDQLSETMSDWMTARRAAKAKVMYDRSLFQNPGPGQGAVVNVDQDVYTAVSKMAGKDSTLDQLVQVLQPSFNPTQYQTTAQELYEQILQQSGYSTQTFGVGDTGTVRTATEIESRERRTLMTRARKIRLWMPAIKELLQKLLAVDNAVFGQSNNLTVIPYVEFPDTVQETQLVLAQTVSALFVSESASRHERVTMMHPDWNDEQVIAECALIEKEAEATMSVPTPFALPPTFGAPDGGAAPAEPAAK